MMSQDSVDAAQVQQAIEALRSAPPDARAREAMSRLFVDETLSPLAIAAIAETLISTHLSTTALDRLFHEEVFPVCASNALAPVGVWPAIDQQWLNEAIERYKHSRIYRWRCRIANALFASKRETEVQWNAIKHYLTNPDRLRHEIAEMRRATLDAEDRR